jgi:hypothetical protein
MRHRKGAVTLETISLPNAPERDDGGNAVAPSGSTDGGNMVAPLVSPLARANRFWRLNVTAIFFRQLRGGRATPICGSDAISPQEPYSVLNV